MAKLRCGEIALCPGRPRQEGVRTGGSREMALRPHCPSVSHRRLPLSPSLQAGYFWAVLQRGGVGHLEFRQHCEDERRRQTEAGGACCVCVCMCVSIVRGPRSSGLLSMISAVVNCPTRSKYNFTSLSYGVCIDGSVR